MSSTTPRFLKLPEASSLSLRDQICEVVSAAIMSDALAYDRPLPSCRELAEQFSVSRNTVFAAYNRLVDLEFLVSRDRSGYFVNPQMALAQKPETDTRSALAEPVPCPVAFPASNLMPVVNPLDWNAYPYPFIYNQIDPDLFPVDGWRECTRQALGRRNLLDWASDSVESDSPRLVQQLRQRLLNTRGIYVEDDEILVTLGSQNALFLLGTIFAKFGKPIALEDPGFFGARNAFRLAGSELVGVPVDGDGLIPAEIPEGCQLIFTTPSHQFPTMVTMSQTRREELLEAAERRDFLIIEDDYEAEMNYVSKSSPSMRSMDRNGRVIYVGSLSKTLSPGIRLGFIVAHRDIIREARVARGVMMRHPPTIVQEIVALFFQLGHYDAHLRNIERRYKKRWHAMNNALSRHLGMLERTESEGGTSFWLTGPEGFDASALARRLRGKGVLIDRGQDYYLNCNDKRSFRLGFAYVPLSKLEQGIKIIADEVWALL
ncbi:transcriptional regulator, gntR family (plasmid) [Ruegeria pomeroyi DSS-3]|uniref:Transcriptional regulator, gntR family n=2 Tax=Ruegeria pomeroyi TaxID=89184 RepID=Q5LKK6_RUEPO|nr:PLP-dependent aminotransferase family protein [Ruegeria pomeroyi]AAV97507.1 transcriptional regulator, gntR family [Ruegeria pomeroyi DSS-3]NVK97841.1 PLP-dependent aminotransferase family protein [Ruegeria pomeroyi]NVL01367.1 PLP-dependent aminotransferase family protein [Ruegeria pomeroyi]HCE71033.1 PLP-dependent aminotransferase family protein [Ruegeria sp.]